jgi:S-sulfosulfanyl-L-cysteine sulfohydrolase
MRLLENAAGNAFNPDPYYRQGGDMIHCAGLSFTIDLGKQAGHCFKRSPDTAARQT